jgi:hypothetical protein
VAEEEAEGAGKKKETEPEAADEDVSTVRLSRKERARLARLRRKQAQSLLLERTARPFVKFEPPHADSRYLPAATTTTTTTTTTTPPQEAPRGRMEGEVAEEKVAPVVKTVLQIVGQAAVTAAAPVGEQGQHSVLEEILEPAEKMDSDGSVAVWDTGEHCLADRVNRKFHRILLQCST